MSRSLATLSRPWGQVLLSDAFASAAEKRWGDAPVQLRAVPEAIGYLRVWRHDAGAMASLRLALASRRVHRAFRLSDDQVIVELATLVASGELQLTERRRVSTAPVWFGEPAGAGALDALEAAPLPRALAPGKLALTPVLELLEQVQIEGAEVLPEVMETLEQLDLSLGRIDLASVSLDPAPSGVRPIDQAMREASESITGTLDDL